MLTAWCCNKHEMKQSTVLTYSLLSYLYFKANMHL